MSKWTVPDAGRFWSSPRMRPVAVSVAVATAAALAVTMAPVPEASAAEVVPPAAKATSEASQPGPDAAAGADLVAKDEIGAVVQARATGRRVEVWSLRSMTSRTWVEPDGLWSTEVAAGPVRFLDEAGRWRDIDLDLVTAADGSVAPVAHPLGLVLPGGDGVAAPSPR